MKYLGSKSNAADLANQGDFSGLTAAQTHAATSKTTPVDADEFPMSDSAASWGIKKLTWANLKLALQSLFFYRGNILGTVSQASGVPTGAIIQRGSNANGEFVKYADGTQICWKIHTVTTTIANSDGGGVLYSSAIDLGAYPASFLGAPAVTLTVSGGAGGFMTSSSVSQTVTNWGSYYLSSGANRASTTYYISCMAVGRWF